MVDGTNFMTNLVKATSLLIFFFSVAMSNLFSYESESPIYLHYVNEITRDFCRIAQREFGMKCQGSGGSMPSDVERITISLKLNRQVQLDEARKLEVLLTERLKNLINTNEKIQPYLRHFPFPAEGADVSISFNHENRDDISYIFHANGTIFYFTEDENRNKNEENFKEKYETALEIVKSSS